jgi:hypothetical protein
MRLFVTFVAALTLAACSDAVPAADDGGSHQDVITDGGDDAGAQPAPPDLAAAATLDLANVDLTGLTNCFGVTVCDPTSQFCIRYNSGSQANPGTLSTPAACFEPTDSCANQGQPMNCGCIQADTALGANCQGSCADHGDGTYDCYKQ